MLFRVGILAIAILATCGPASAQVKVQIGDLAQSLNEIASRVMIDQGIDRKYGIAAEYRAYPTLDGLFTAIRGKDVDIGFGGVDRDRSVSQQGLSGHDGVSGRARGDGRRHRTGRVANQEHR